MGRKGELYMCELFRRGYSKAVLFLSAGVLALGTSACSTTSTVKVAQNAPITYKVGQGATQYASVTMPRRSSPSPYQSTQQRAPYVSVPEVSRPYVQAPQPSQPLSQPSFDASRVDHELYKHQKVGKTYKIMGKSYTPKHQPNYNVVGVASWYGDKFHGKPTATGEIYDKNDLTAAHKTLPLNSMLYVTNLENGRSLMVRLNDRGPFIGDRIIDLSEAAAIALGTQANGLGKVRVQYAGPADPMAAKDGVAAPRPQRQEVPMIVEAPQRVAPAQPEYQPLREAPVSETPSYEAQAPLPYSNSVPQVPTPRVAAPVPAPIAPQAPQSVDGGEANDGQVTLTIKGPIHVAGYSEYQEQPRLIRGK